MIKASDLHKSYKNLHVLKGINLEVERGEIVCIVGASGAGKTTLLQILGTLDKPDSGKVYFKGQDITSLQGKKLARFRNEELGFIFQFHHLLPEFTALENVCIPAFIKGTSKNEAISKARYLLDFFNLGDRAEHKPAQLSGGEQQRVAVARAMMNDPQLILADEPSGNLDSKNAEELHRMFFKMRDNFKQTFIIVTHNEKLAQMADRVIHIHDGKVQEPEHEG